MTKFACLVAIVFLVSATSQQLINQKKASIPHQVEDTIRGSKSFSEDGFRNGIKITDKIADVFRAVHDGKNVDDAGINMLQLVPTFSKLLAPVLGDIGKLFSSIINLFLPNDESEELKAIQKGFGDMHARFDQLSRQIDQLGAKLDFYEAIDPYRDVRNSLENVYLNYKRLAEEPTSEGHRKNFINVCTNRMIEPSQALEKLHRIIVKPGLADSPHILTSIIKKEQLDYKVVMGWFESITSDAYKLGILQSACFGILYQNDTVGIQHSAKEAAKWINEIIAELSKFEKKFTSLGPEYLSVLKSELGQVMQNAKYDVTAEQRLIDKCSYMKGTATQKAFKLCKGDDEVRVTNVAVNTHLQTKFAWLKWLVVVYINEEKSKDYPCDDDGSINHFLLVESGDKRLFVTWSRPDPMIDQNVNQAINLLQRVITDNIEVNSVRADTFDQQIRDIQNSLHRGWRSLPKNRLFCVFGGPTKGYWKWSNHYRRSIFTSGIGTFRSLYKTGTGWDVWQAFYDVDFVISFYTDNK